MATLTGLEPATSAVTGRRANQLRYRALLVGFTPLFTGFEPGSQDLNFSRGKPRL